MHNYTDYPTVDVSYSVKSYSYVTPSQFKSEKEPEQSSQSLSSLNDQSSTQLISHNEVLEMFQVSSKATIYKWRQTRGFPDPVTLMPLRWLRTAVEEWKDSIGGYGR
ncbi:helix-turn-helix transcriptional regulator [Photobacterium nomapromontoriensis]|uniref:helix-turn-helix transcriptional regulator n=1 Tax=Photobacterium nomapromontoriensis TaxID=2910237 RepID=UPI003D10262F